jgi:hypothetical protein
MYIRKVKKGNKFYHYYYKSKRVGNKVKSIYVGRALESDVKGAKSLKILRVKKPDSPKDYKSNKIIVDNLLEFDNLLNEVNKLIMNKDLNNALFIYNKLFETYNKIEVDHKDKAMVFEKLNNIYDKLIELGKEVKLDLS